MEETPKQLVTKSHDDGRPCLSLSMVPWSTCRTSLRLQGPAAHSDELLRFWPGRIFGQFVIYKLYTV